MPLTIDGYYVAAEIRLLRQVHKGTILIVEGETDQRILDRFTDSSSCEIQIAQGKKNVLNALDLLEDEGFEGVLAIIDADFDRLLGVNYQLDNLYLTDAHDFDLTVFASSAFDHYLNEFADSQLVNKISGGDLIALRGRLLQASLPVSYCRIASKSHALRISFKSLRHADFTDDATLAVDENKLVTELISRSSATCTKEELRAYVLREAKANYDLYQLANGHDVCAMLGIALRKLIATRRDVQTWASEIEAGLRLAFDWDAIGSTNLYKGLRTWEGSNPGYKIFRV